MSRQAHNIGRSSLAITLSFPDIEICAAMPLEYATLQLPQSAGGKHPDRNRESLILPFRSERLPKEQHHFKTSRHWSSIYFSKLKLQCKRTALELDLVLFKLTWPEWGLSVSIQAPHLQKAHSALQYNTPDLQARAPDLGAQPRLLRAPWVAGLSPSCAVSAVTARGSESFLLQSRPRIQTASATLRSSHAQEIS